MANLLIVTGNHEQYYFNMDKVQGFMFVEKRGHYKLPAPYIIVYLETREVLIPLEDADISKIKDMVRTWIGNDTPTQVKLNEHTKSYIQRQRAITPSPQAVSSRVVR